MSLSKYNLAFARSGPTKYARYRILKKISRSIAKNEKCLDLGTGKGALAYYYAQSGHWTFVDNLETRITAAKTLLRGDFVVSTAQDYAKNTTTTFDHIFLVEVIYYIPQFEIFLQSLIQSINANGRMILTSIVDTDRVDKLTRLRARLRVDGTADHQSQISHSLLVRFFESSGFNVATHVYCRFFGIAAQTFIDFFSKETADSTEHTERFLSKNDPTLKNWILLWAVSLFAKAAYFLDWLIPIGVYGYCLEIRRTQLTENKIDPKHR